MAAALAFLTALCSCGAGGARAYTAEGDSTIYANDLDSIRRRGILRVVTTEGAFSYYVDSKDRTQGYDYALASNFADYLDLEMELIVADDVPDMLDILERGEADIAAYRVAYLEKNRARFLFTEKGTYTTMVLVQRRGFYRVGDATELIGKTVLVPPESKYAIRMRNLNDEVGGGIDIKVVPDTVTVDDLMYMVSRGEADYCVADDDIAALNNTRLQNLDAGMKVSLPQKKGWAVRRDAPKLLDAVNAWQAEMADTKLVRRLRDVYISHNTYYDRYKADIPKGAVSPYDDIFKRCAKEIGWDWRMLAALAWNESHFNPYAESLVGAKGIMQMMPRTAAKYGLDSVTIHDPERSIEAGVQYIKRLNMIFARVEDSEERIKFILAGYNAGPGHVLDAMALAEKYGENPYVWDGAVSKYLLLKNKPEYYKDPVCHSGFFRGKHTVRYVTDVYRTYEKYLGMK